MVPVGDAQVLVAVLYICYSALHPFRMDPLPSLWNVLPHLSSSNDIASSLHPVNISLTLGIRLDISGSGDGRSISETIFETVLSDELQRSQPPCADQQWGQCITLVHSALNLCNSAEVALWCFHPH